MDRNSFQVTSNWVCSTRSQRQFAPQQLWCTYYFVRWMPSKWQNKKLEESLRARTRACMCARSHISENRNACTKNEKKKHLCIPQNYTHFLPALLLDGMCFVFVLAWFGFNLHTFYTHLLHTRFSRVTVRIELINAANH